MIRFALPAVTALVMVVIALLDIFEVLPKGSTTTAVLFVPLSAALSGTRCLRRQQEA
ncbi:MULTISPECIES: hypothetical protein [Novosphingobium]|jgi:hypothetical protein|uniref:Uncharacterized protein n=1 Tax=Novosphingobium subterraneum TaxID=48936 RepID=A0A0B8ZND2_9SPHN|nr:MULTISPECIES: hypothetical protein [Novosphingobium]KHS47728.1 hypothetical protein NJ75_01524 [Novosphingobium subterraneum]